MNHGSFTRENHAILNVRKYDFRPPFFFGLTGENNSLIEETLSNVFRSVYDTRKIFGHVLFERQIVKICFSLCFREPVAFPFENKHQRTTQPFAVFFDKFLSFKSFPSIFFIVKKTKESCNPWVGDV